MSYKQTDQEKSIRAVTTYQLINDIVLLHQAVMFGAPEAVQAKVAAALGESFAQFISQHNGTATTVHYDKPTP